MSYTTIFLDLGAVLVVTLAAWLLGRAVRAAMGVGRGGGGGVGGSAYGMAVEVAAGLAVLHVVLLGLDLLDVAWRVASVGLAVVVAVAVLRGGAWLWRRRGEAQSGEVEADEELPGGGGKGELSGGERTGLGWGDAVVLVVFGWLVFLLPSGVATTPDFVYQWGIKGHRFLLAGGVDWAWLAGPLGNAPSPDYPNLVPELFALVSMLRGGFSEAASALWTPLYLLLAWAGARAACGVGGMGRLAHQASVAALGLLMGMFTVGYRLAGGADLAIAAALLLALPPLLGRRGPGSDFAIGAAVALAVASKLEGLPLAVALCGVYWVMRWFRSADDSAPLAVTSNLERGRCLLRTLALPMAVVLPWALQVARYDLFGRTHPGGPVRWAALDEVLAAVGSSVAAPEWHGLGWLVLLVPLLLVPRRIRAVGVVLTLQAAAYLAVYLRHPGEAVETYVLINAPRLVFHLVPAALVAAAVVLAGRRRLVTRVVLAGLVLWTGAGFLAEQWTAVDTWRWREGPGVVARWRLGEERSESLRAFLAEVDRATYPGSVLAFDPAVDDADSRFYLTRWAAYFLPAKQVIHASRPDALGPAHYLVTYNHHRPPPGGDRILLHPSGSVFWLGEPRERP